MKVLVTGVGGQLGHDVMNELAKRGYEGVGSDIAPAYSGVADGSAVTTMPYVAMDITNAAAVAETIKEDEDLEIYTSGANNIFKYPELSDNQKASDLINAFEEKQLLTQLIDDTNTEGKNEIKVYIGEESPIQTMKDCSIVTANYEFGDGMRGMIGIIGPKRMDYDKVVGTIKTIKSQLDTMYKKDED